MSDIAIRAENISKRYQIGHLQSPRGAISWRLDVRDWMRGLAHPTSNVQSPTSDHIWALKDVSLEVKRGEVVGIIGRNGSGKSTLLKILSRITKPTEGHAEIHGRVATLLEVGTGFHPELTGRENTYLSGAVLGMKKTEIDRKFDEIIAFAEIEKFIDTPVKHYSSGMYVRLAFAVAAHLEPEILLVDEVLAVGDAAFQKKCLGKMGDVAREGRTVLFVSHNMGAVTSLCNRSLLLEKGVVRVEGDTSKVAAAYQAGADSRFGGRLDLSTSEHHGSGKARFTSIDVTPVDSEGIVQGNLKTGGMLKIAVTIKGIREINNANVAIIIYSSSGFRLIDVNTAIGQSFLSLRSGQEARVEFHLRQVLLKPGTYLIGLWLGRGAVEEIDSVDYAESFDVEANWQSARHSETFPGPYQCSFSQQISIVS